MPMCEPGDYGDDWCRGCGVDDGGHTDNCPTQKVMNQTD